MNQTEMIKQNYEHLKNNKYFYLSLTLMTVSIFIVFAIRPSVIKTIQTYNDLKKLNDLKISMELKKADIESAKEILNSNNVEIELIQKSLPSTPLESEIAKDIYQMASNNGLSLSSIKFQNTEATIDPDINAVKFDLNLIGKYGDLYNFINEFNNYIRASKITSIKVSEYKEYKGALINVNATGEAYYKIR